MKRFNIHDWQAKRRLVEQDEFQKRQDALTPGKNPDYFYDDDSLMSKMKKSQESMSNADIGALQKLIGAYNFSDVLSNIAEIADKTGKHEESEKIGRVAYEIKRSELPLDMQDHEIDFRPYEKNLLQKIIGNNSLNKILNVIAVIADGKGKHDEADDIKKLADQIQDFLMDMDEMNTTGTGVSFNAGTGMGHFGKSKKKRRTNEQEESDNMTDDQLAQWRKDNLEEPEEEPGKEPEKKDAKSISGLADAFRDMGIALRKGEYKGVQGAEIMEINQLMDLVIKAADQANITTIIQRLEVMVGKTIKK
tara:strand:+ start:79 stop:996 length:918 start_codon:yes stop_codon:yes gene_type:complete